MSVRFVVRGRVQGVGFRWFVMRRARELGVSGHVRNLDDGSVDVLADGPADALERLAASLAVGPPAAHVGEVVRVDARDAVTMGRFEVR